MAKNDLSNKYFVSTDNSTWYDITTKWSGIKVLALSGLGERGDAVNVYNEQWITSQNEDFMVAASDGKVVRKNVDLSLTFIVSRRYANTTIDEQSVYDDFVSYVCDNGAFYIKSMYYNKSVKVACLKSFKPTDVKLQRGRKSYIMATVTLHTLKKPMDI